MKSQFVFGLGLVAAVAAFDGCQTAPAARGRYDGAAARVNPKHVIVVGFDGLAGYAVTNSPAPTMHRMMKEGAWTVRSRSILPSSSSLNWHSFFTCSASEQHGFIDWNSSTPKFAAMETTERGLYPDLFSEYRRIRPDAEIGLFHEWPGISNTVDLAACSKVERVSPSVIKKALDYIENKKPNFLAICLDHPDRIGHGKGWGSPEYMKNLLEIDALLAKVVEAIERAGIADDTVVVVFSDHGGRNKGHGGPTLAEMERPSLFMGKGVKAGYEFESSGAIYDDGATVAALLGIVDPPKSWIGRPRHDAFK